MKRIQMPTRDLEPEDIPDDLEDEEMEERLRQERHARNVLNQPM